MQADYSIGDFNTEEGKTNAKNLVAASTVSDVSRVSLTRFSANDHGTIGPYYTTSIKVFKIFILLIAYFYCSPARPCLPQESGPN